MAAEAGSGVGQVDLHTMSESQAGLLEANNVCFGHPAFPLRGEQKHADLTEEVCCKNVHWTQMVKSADRDEQAVGFAETLV